jgi:hypothetical protein
MVTTSQLALLRCFVYVINQAGLIHSTSLLQVQFSNYHGAMMAPLFPEQVAAALLFSVTLSTDRFLGLI